MMWNTHWWFHLFYCIFMCLSLTQYTAVAESTAGVCVCDVVPVMWPDFKWNRKYWCTGLNFLLVVNDSLVIDSTFRKFLSSHLQLLTLSVCFILSYYITLSFRQTSKRTMPIKYSILRDPTSTISVWRTAGKFGGPRKHRSLGLRK